MDDTWIGKDKVWHFGVSLVLAVVCPVVAVVAAVRVALGTAAHVAALN